MRNNPTKLEQEQSFCWEGAVHLLLINFIHPQDLCRALLLPYILVFTQQSWKQPCLKATHKVLPQAPGQREEKDTAGEPQQEAHQGSAEGQPTRDGVGA